MFSPISASFIQPKAVKYANQAVGNAFGPKLICGQCGKPADLKCSKCKQICYCNRQCQGLAWKTHKTVCADYKQDEKGFTRLHYAVLDGTEEQLAQQQKELLGTVKDSFNGTPADLKALMEEPEENLISLSMKYDGAVNQLTQQQFFELTGVKFKSDFVVNPAVIRDLHIAPEKCLYSADRSMPFIDSGLERFLSKPPLLFLIEEPPMGLGVQAAEDIAEGEIICTAGGELAIEPSNSYKSKLYRLQKNSHMHRVSGVGALINDGFPNCQMAYLKNYKGLPYCVVLRATRPIKRGENLYRNYGPNHGLRGGHYFISEQSYQEAVQFCQSNNFYQIDKFTSDYQIESLVYLFSAASIFILLHLRDVLDVAKTKKLLQNRLLQSKFLETKPLFFEMYDNILTCIQKLKQLQLSDPQIILAMESLKERLTESALVQMLLLMQNDSALSSAEIAHYEALGELYDHLYWAVNGTYTSTYLDCEPDPGELHPDNSLDVTFIHTKYVPLPRNLQKQFKVRVEVYMDFLIMKKNQDANAKAVMMLLATLPKE